MASAHAKLHVLIALPKMVPRFLNAVRDVLLSREYNSDFLDWINANTSGGCTCCVWKNLLRFVFLVHEKITCSCPNQEFQEVSWMNTMYRSKMFVLDGLV